MAPLRPLICFTAVTATGAFAPSGRTPFAARSSPVAVEKADTSLSSSVFDEGAKDWAEEYGPFAEWGWGPTVLAEKWNGRHAMFGWVVICATAYAKGHGLIPDADVPLDLKEWGTLATISGKTTITNERAIILIANVHAFMVGLMATIAPSPWADPLLLDPTLANSDDLAAAKYEKAIERNKNPYGIIPDFKTGLTEEAEMYNGRLAMLGLCTVCGASAITGKPILDIVNEWLGGAYY